MPVRLPLLLAAHDAGGAENVAAWARKHSASPFAVVVEGPARRVFENGIVPAARILSREEAFRCFPKVGTLLTGSSWSSDLERVLVDRAKAAGVRTVVFLDNWTEYRERLLIDERLVLPDEIWVGDQYAEDLARKTFPGISVRNVGNDYLEGLAAEVRSRSAARPGTGCRLLFLGEPLAAAAEHKYGNARHHGYTELDALDALLEHARERWAGEIEAMRIRRHPAEAPGKYSAYTGKADFPIVECGDSPLLEDCAWADRVAGCQSMAMVVAFLAGKEVYSAIPRGGRPCAIPLPGIVPLFQPPQHAQPRASFQGNPL